MTIRSRKSGLLRQYYFYIHKLSSIFPLLLSPPGNKITDAGVLLYTPRQHQDIVPRRQQRRHSVHLCFPREWKRRVKNKGPELNRRGEKKWEERWTDGASSPLTWSLHGLPLNHCVTRQTWTYRSVSGQQARALWLYPVQCVSGVNCSVTELGSASEDGIQSLSRKALSLAQNVSRFRSVPLSILPSELLFAMWRSLTCS